jgi:hypothetical protein
MVHAIGKKKGQNSLGKTLFHQCFSQATLQVAPNSPKMRSSGVRLYVIWFLEKDVESPLSGEWISLGRFQGSKVPWTR